MRNFFLLITAVSLSGCANISTYPHVEIETILPVPSSTQEPVPTIMAKVLVYAHEHYGGMDEIVFNLPKGVGGETYSIVANTLGDAVPMDSVEQVAYHITELRVRGFSAEADVTFPSPSGGYEEATIRLESAPFSDWSVTRERVWLIPSKTAPTPNYRAMETDQSDEVIAP